MRNFNSQANPIFMLGPTNTGKTHFAVERMMGYSSGIIGFPLRLLAREVYEKVVAIKGKARVALLTGEEKIIPPGAKYYLCTVESMPKNIPVDFVGVDEVQLAGDINRGHIFTSKLFHARGRFETMFMGSDTIRPFVKRLFPDAEITTRERFSGLSYIPPKKIHALPPRTAVVAFTMDDVYGLAELLKRKKGGAAVILGALSPRTRNAQAELFQSGEVDYLVATDAIGMGLNLDIDHVAFADVSKFDGRVFRELNAQELAQIAGRAGRHMNEGTFSTIGGGFGVEIDPYVINQIEDHRFPPLKKIMWRNAKLDFRSGEALLKSLQMRPISEGLTLIPKALDERVLEAILTKNRDAQWTRSVDKLQTLWDICQVPDFKGFSPSDHLHLADTLCRQLIEGPGQLDEDWLAGEIKTHDKTTGDLHILMKRIASMRSWTYITHRKDWVADSDHWAHLARKVEDKLSDTLHNHLTQRFIDRKTSVLLRTYKDKGLKDLTIGETGEILIEGQLMGHLKGFTFVADASSGEKREDHKALVNKLEVLLKDEISARVKSFLANEKPNIKLDTSLGLNKPRIAVDDIPLASVQKGQRYLLPKIKLLKGTLLMEAEEEAVLTRITNWFDHYVTETCPSLAGLEVELNGHPPKPKEGEEAPAPLTGMARGIAFRLLENQGVLPRYFIEKDLRGVTTDERKGLWRFRVRIGASTLFVPNLLKPAATELRLALWAIENDITDLPEVPTPGMVWCEMAKNAPKGFYRIAGFRKAGQKAVRVDMMERLADAVRDLGADGKEFDVTPEIMGLVGLSGDDFAAVMTAIGYKVEKKEIENPSLVSAHASGDATASRERETVRDAQSSVTQTQDGSSEDKTPAEEKPAKKSKAPSSPEQKDTNTEVPEKGEPQLEEQGKRDRAPEQVRGPSGAEAEASGVSSEENQLPQVIEKDFFKWEGPQARHFQQKQKQHGPRNNKGGQQAKGGKGQNNNKGPNKNKGGKPQRGNKRPQNKGGFKAQTNFKADVPDSNPFAALKTLKDSMEKPKGKSKKKKQP